MSFTKNKFILEVLVAAFVATVFVIPMSVSAQTVTTADWTEMKRLEKALEDKWDSFGVWGHTWNRTESLNDPGYVALKQQAWTQCGKIGESLKQITKGSYSTKWLNNDTCVNAFINKPNTPGTDDFSKFLNRSYSAMPAGNSDSLLAVVQNPEKPASIDQTTYTEMVQKQAQDGSIGTAAQGVSKFVGWIIDALGSIVASGLAFIATIAIYLLDVVIKMTLSSDTPNIVDRGWVIIRDFMNLFFILALIVMALATILRQEAYNYKNLLFKLVLMALLINFSKVIAETLIGVSNMLISMFRLTEGFIEPVKLVFNSFVVGGDNLSGLFGTGAGVGESTLNVITKIVGLVVLTIAFGSVAILMFIRMVGLWFLVMLSPVAYALNILPRTQEYSKQWWDTLIKYLIWGPVAMFFFKLSIVFMQEQANNSFANSAISNMFIAAFVYAGFLVAKKAGMVGASSVTGFAEGAMKSYSKSALGFTGNLAWRGTAPAAVAGTAGYFVGKATGRENLGKDWFKKTQEKIGGVTANIQNAPGLLKKKFVEDPNADRKKLVDRERRRSLIKRDFLKDLDEDTAKQITPEDVAYMIRIGKMNEGKANNIMEHGKTNAKLAMMLAFRDGSIPLGNNNLPAGYPSSFTEEQRDAVFEKVREFAWKHKGRKLETLENNPGFLRNREAMATQVQVRGKNRDFQENGGIDNHAKNANIRIDPTNEFRDRSGRGGQGQADGVVAADARGRIIQPEEATDRAQTGDERLNARRAAAGRPPVTPTPPTPPVTPAPPTPGTPTP